MFALVLSLAFAACEQTPPADQSGTQQTEPSGDDPTPPDGGGEEQEDPDTQPEDPDGPEKTRATRTKVRKPPMNRKR